MLAAVWAAAYPSGMGRPRRVAAGDLIYHVLNRANARLPLFHKEGDYVAFENVLAEALARVPVRLLGYCVMPNHWHLVVWPRADGDLSRFVGWLSLTHTQRWRAHYHNVGSGHLYQGRFKSFLVQDDTHYLAVCRYVERNALRAGLVARAEAWRWGSLWRRQFGTPSEQAWLSAGPLAWPADWVERVNMPLGASETAALQECVRRGRPYGEAAWVQRTAAAMGLQATLRPLGRPKKPTGIGS